MSPDEFHKLLEDAIKKHTTEKTISRAKYIWKPWITPGLIKCINHRDKLHKESNKHPKDQTKKLVYTRYRNFFTNLMHKLKHDYESKKLEENKANNKGLWNTIKTITEQHNSTSSPIDLLQCKSTAQYSVNYCNEY